MDGGFGQDTSSKDVFVPGQSEFTSNVEKGVPDCKGEGEQTLYGSDSARPGARSQGHKRISPRLELRQREGAEAVGDLDHQ